MKYLRKTGEDGNLLNRIKDFKQGGLTEATLLVA